MRECASGDGARPAESSTPSAQELVRTLPELLRSTRRVRVFDRRGRVEPARKRRERLPSSVLADLTDDGALAALLAALRLRPDTEIMDWMSWPDVWFGFTDRNGAALVTVGLLQPDWLRWEPHGDLRLAAPESLTKWLSTWT